MDGWAWSHLSSGLEVRRELPIMLGRSDSRLRDVSLETDTESNGL